MLLPRYKGGPDVNDYNMIIMTERAKINEIAKVYRLANRSLSIKELKREMIFADSSKSVVGYFELRRQELYRRREISFQTWKNYGTTIGRIKEFQYNNRFDQIRKKWMDLIKAYLKKE